MTLQLLRLAWDLEARGFTGREVAVREVVRVARAARLSPVLVDVLADPSEPEVARLRAFGHIATALSRSPSGTGGDTGLDAA
jgi:hypothetical protein